MSTPSGRFAPKPPTSRRFSRRPLVYESNEGPRVKPRCSPTAFDAFERTFEAKIAARRRRFDCRIRSAGVPVRARLAPRFWQQLRRRDLDPARAVGELGSSDPAGLGLVVRLVLDGRRP